MLFGKSVFQSILTRLDEEHVDETEIVPAAGFRVSGLPMGFVAETFDGPEPTQTNSFFHLYGADEEDLSPPDNTSPEEQQAPVMPTHLSRLTDAEIADDLDLKPDDIPEKLMARRRAFAKLNHPDRVHPEFRAQATRRMTVANMLIDQALRQRLTR